MAISCFIMTIKGNCDDLFLCLDKPLRQNGNGSFYLRFIHPERLRRRMIAPAYWPLIFLQAIQLFCAALLLFCFSSGLLLI